MPHPIRRRRTPPPPAGRAPVSPADLLPLSAPVYQILLSLVDRDLHGYAIILDVRERTDGEVRLTASTLYAAIKRLLDTGLIDEARDRPDPDEDDERRRYYALTACGREVLTLEARRLERAASMARDKHLLPDLHPARARRT